MTRVPVLTGGGQDLVSGAAGYGGEIQPGLVIWAAGRRRWRAGVGDEIAGGRTTSVVLSRESDGG